MQNPSRRKFLKTSAAAFGAALGGTVHRARLRVRSQRAQQPDHGRLHRQRQSEHARPAGVPGTRRRPGGGGLRRQHRQLRLQDAGPVPGTQTGSGQGQRVLRRQAGLRPVQGLRCLQRFPRGAGPRRHRRGGDRRSRPLARPDGGRRRQGGQGHVLREAALADRRPRAGDGQSGPRAQADLADGQPLPIQPGQSICLRIGAQRADRRGQADLDASRGEQRGVAGTGLAADAGAGRV